MKFAYGYRTKDNETREGTVSASSRDAAYAELKRRGIHPFRVELAPGVLNRIRSLGKRTLALVVLAVVAAAAAYLAYDRTVAASAADPTGPCPRHQIYGDPARMEELLRTDFAEVFAQAGDRLLARYAQPGQLVKVSAPRERLADDLKAAIALPDERCVVFAEGEAREVRELKCIVLGMRAEFRRYLANGIGTPARYLLRLNERQNREAQIYFTAKNDIEKAGQDLEKCERINASLRTLGIRTVPLPEPE